MAAFIKINGHEYPCPRRGLEMLVATIVDSARNANAVVVGQVVGREQQKLNNLEWAYLTAEQWLLLPYFIIFILFQWFYLFYSFIIDPIPILRYT